MGAHLALAADLQRASAVALALPAAAVLAGPAALRRPAMALALVLTPVVLIAQIYDAPQFLPIRHHPRLALALGAGAVAILVLAAAGLRRAPAALPVLASAALPFRIPIQAGGTTSNLLVPLYLVVGAGVLAHVLPLPVGRAPEEPLDSRPARHLERALAAFLVLYAGQALYSDDLGRAVDQMVFFYIPFALLFGMLVRARWSPRTVAWSFAALVGLALAFTGIGFVEYHTRTLLFNPKVIDSNQFESYFRVNSLFFDPNIYGRFLALVMLGLAAALVWTSRPRVALASAGLLAVLWAGLVLTFSQSSFVALLVGLAVLGGLRWDARRALAATALVLAGGAVFVAARPGALHLDPGSSTSVNKATSGRADLIRGGVELFLDRPLEGYGSGSFARTYRRRGKGSGEKAVSASHTIPITVAAEQGVAGLAAYLAVLVAGFSLLFANARGGAAPAGLAAALAALVLHTLLYAAFLEDPTTWVVLASGAALACAARGGGAPRGARRTGRPRAALPAG